MDDAAIEATAASWLVQKEEGFSPEQAAEFARWQEADSRHAAAVGLLSATCQILAKMPLLPDDSLRHEAANGSKKSRRSKSSSRVLRFPLRPRSMVLIAAAAAVAMTFAAGWLRSSRDAFSATYATAPDGYQRVVLPDESVLELNAATEVNVRYSHSARHVALARGEAHFTVAKNPERPFLVGAGSIGVRAVGTAFNVRRETALVEVIVTEGRVQISQTPAATTRSFPAKAGDEATVVTAGQRVVVSMENPVAFDPRISAIDSGSMAEALGWQAPRLVFVGTPLAEVAQQFNRHNHVQLKIGDPELGLRAVGGTFLAGNVETFVQLLQASRDIAVERPDADHIVLRRVAPVP